MQKIDVRHLICDTAFVADLVFRKYKVQDYPIAVEVVVKVFLLKKNCL